MTPPIAIELAPLVRGELGDVARVHLDAFPTSALGNLGTEALRRYYEWLLVGPHRTTALGARRDGELVGFLFGGTFNGAMTGFLHANRAYLAWRVATHPWLVASPLVRDRMTKAVRLLAKRARGKAPAPAATARAAQPARPPAFGILAIAVASKCQGLGVGKALMVRAEQAARANAFDRMHLTVAPTNAQAIAFYERGGWSKLVDGGRAWAGAMTKSLR